MSNNKVKIRAIQNRVVVEPIVDESIITISHTSNSSKNPSKGIVLSAGKGTKDENMEVAKGDIIKFSSVAGARIKESGQNVIILDQRDIFYILEE